MRPIVAARCGLLQLAIDHGKPSVRDALAVRLRQDVEQPISSQSLAWRSESRRSGATSVLEYSDALRAVRCRYFDADANFVDGNNGPGSNGTDTRLGERLSTRTDETVVLESRDPTVTIDPTTTGLAGQAAQYF